MNKEGLKTMALIAGVGAAAMVDELHPHPHGKTPAVETKKLRKHRNKKKRLVKASRKRNRK